MAFPANPTKGQVWTEFGKSWVFDGSGWGAAVAPLTVSAALQSRTVSQLVDAGADTNKQFRCTDAPGGETIVYSDGATYRRISDNSPVVT